MIADLRCIVLTAQLNVLLDNAGLDIIVPVTRHDRALSLDRPPSFLSDPRRDFRSVQAEPAGKLGELDARKGGRDGCREFDAESLGEVGVLLRKGLDCC